MPSVAFPQVQRGSTFNGQLHTQASNGTRYASSYYGTETPTGNFATGFADGMAKGAALGALASARMQGDDIFEGCTAERG